MIYKCYACDNLFNEDDGFITYKNIIGFGILGTSMVFICKNCMGSKTRAEFEKLNKTK